MLPLYDKVLAGGLAGVVSTVVVGVLAALGIALPATVVSAIVVVIVFGVSYLKTETKVGRALEADWEAMQAEGPAKG